MFFFLIHLLIHFVWFALFFEINNKMIPQFRSHAIIFTWTRYTVNYFSSLFSHFRSPIQWRNKKINKHTRFGNYHQFWSNRYEPDDMRLQLLIWFSLFFIVEIDKLCNGTEIGHFAKKLESEKKRKKSVRKFSTFHGFFALDFYLQNSTNFLHSFDLFKV